MEEKSEILKLLKCPRCGTYFKDKLNCSKCKYTLKVDGKIWIFDEFLTEEMKREDEVNRKITDPTMIKKGYALDDMTIIEGERNVFVIEKTIETLKSRGLLKSRMITLELGGARGWLTYILSKYVKKAYYIDISHCFMEHSRNISFLIPMQDLNKVFRKESFDLVWVNASLHHCDNLDIVFKNVLDILKKEGSFIITNDLIVGLCEFHKKDIDSAKKEGAQDKIYHMYDYVRSARRSGFDVSIEVPPDIPYYYLEHVDEIKTPLKRFLFKVCKKIGILQLTNARLFRNLYIPFANLLGSQVTFICRKINRDKQ